MKRVHIFAAALILLFICTGLSAWYIIKLRNEVTALRSNLQAIQIKNYNLEKEKSDLQNGINNLIQPFEDAQKILSDWDKLLNESSPIDFASKVEALVDNEYDKIKEFDKRKIVLLILRRGKELNANTEDQVKRGIEHEKRNLKDQSNYYDALKKTLNNINIDLLKQKRDEEKQKIRQKNAALQKENSNKGEEISNKNEQINTLTANNKSLRDELSKYKHPPKDIWLYVLISIAAVESILIVFLIITVNSHKKEESISTSKHLTLSESKDDLHSSSMSKKTAITCPTCGWKYTSKITECENCKTKF